MELHILGQVRLRTHEQIDVGPTKVRGLLGYLAYHANEAVHVDRIVEALWDDDRPAEPGKRIQPQVSRLRRAFRDSGFAADVKREASSYRLEIEPSAVDYHRFRSTVRSGHRARGRGELPRAAELFASAVRMWTGPPLADLNTTWARRVRATLTHNELIPAYCGLFDTRLALGDHESVLTELQRLLTEHATEEQLAVQWVRALAAANRSTEVPTFYREFAQRLADDLGVPPSAELVQAVTEATQPRRAAAARPPTPPRATPYFTGRTELLERLDALLAGDDRDVDVVILDGLPGVGKTTLARQWARRQRERFPDGVLAADLSGYADTPLIEPHTVMADFLKELGVAQIPSDTNERATLLRHTLSTRDALVLLDNVRDSTHARPLLAATTGCRTLITSRQQLTGIVYRDGAQRLMVPALPDDDAATLLEKCVGDRAAADPAATTTLVELCRGLPLALRIAGEHIAARPAVPISDLATELRQEMRLLDAGSHGDDHTTTLRATFSWSYHSLRTEEQRAFRLVGLHPTPRFDVRAAGALLGNNTVADVEHLLDSLVGAHLVAQERAGRYSVHDLIYDYASAVVEEHPDPRDPALRRMFDWYLNSARNARELLVSDDQPVPELPPAEPVEPVTFDDADAALRWLVTEFANLVACTYRAAELSYHDHVWRLSAYLHTLSRHVSPRSLLEVHELGRRSAAITGQAAAVGGCLNNKGTAYALQGNQANAGRCFELAHEAFVEAGDTRGVAVSLHNTGVTYLYRGQPAMAIAWLTRAMNARVDSDWAIANTYRRLGDAFRMLHDVASARSHYRVAAYTSQKVGDQTGHASCLRCLAQLSLDEDRVEDALRYGQEALDIFDRVRVDRTGAAATLMTLAATHLRRDAYPTAIAMADEATRIYRETDDKSGQIDALILLGRALAASGESAKAAQTWRSAQALIDSPSDPRSTILGELVENSGDRPIPTPRTTDQTVGNAQVQPEDIAVRKIPTLD